MADHSVGTSYMKAKLVMQSLMFCFAVDLFCLFFDVATSCCVSEYSLNASRRDRNVPSGSPLRKIVDLFSSLTRSSRSPRELKFVCYVSG